QSFSVGCHDAVFDTVVDHFDEVAGSIGAAMQISVFGCPANVLAVWRTGDVAETGRQCRENRIKAPHRLGFSSNHHAITTFQTPDAATCADVDIMDFSRRQLLCSPYVIDVVRIASV